MKTVSLLSVVLLLPAASLLAKGQSEIEILRARVDVQERKITQLEKALNRLTGSPVHSTVKSTHTKAVPVTQKATSAKATSTSTREYVVAKGDILTRIAYRHHTTVAAIRKENNLKSDGLRIGQKLRIPAVSTPKSAEAVPRKDSVKSSKTVATTSPTPSKTSTSSSKTLTGKYTVKAGDTFYGIARQYQMNEATLQAANPKAVPTRLQIGQVLVVKPGSKSSPAPKPSTVAKKASAPKASKPKAETSKSSVAKSSAPKKSASSTPKPSGFRTITVHQQMTYGAFASRHGASTSQLNSLNGLNLSKSAMLAKGSELYVPQF